MSTYDLNVYVDAINEARRKIPNGTPGDNLDAHRTIDLVAHTLAELVANDNPHFDASEFFRATSTVPPTKET